MHSNRFTLRLLLIATIPVAVSCWFFRKGYLARGEPLAMIQVFMGCVVVLFTLVWFARVVNNKTMEVLVLLMLLILLSTLLSFSLWWVS